MYIMGNERLLSRSAQRHMSRHGKKNEKQLEARDVLPNIKRSQAAETAVFVPGDLDL